MAIEEEELFAAPAPRVISPRMVGQSQEAPTSGLSSSRVGKGVDPEVTTGLPVLPGNKTPSRTRPVLSPTSKPSSTNSTSDRHRARSSTAVSMSQQVGSAAVIRPICSQGIQDAIASDDLVIPNTQPPIRLAKKSSRGAATQPLPTFSNHGHDLVDEIQVPATQPVRRANAPIAPPVSAIRKFSRVPSQRDVLSAGYEQTPVRASRASQDNARTTEAVIGGTIDQVRKLFVCTVNCGR